MESVRWDPPLFFMSAGEAVYVGGVQDGRLHQVAFCPVEHLAALDLDALAARPFLPDAQIHLRGDDRPRVGKRWLGCSLTEAAEVVDHRMERHDDGPRLVVRAEDDISGFAVEHVYDAFDRSSCLRRSVRVENGGSEPRTLEHVAPLCMPLWPGDGGTLDDLWFWDVGGGWCWEGKVGVTPMVDLGIHDRYSMGAHIIETPGSWTTKTRLPVFGIEDHRSSRSWAAQVEPVGSWRLEVGAFHGGVYLQAGGGNLAGSHWQHTLLPGESYTSPSVTVSVAAGGRDAAVNHLQGHRVRHLIHRSDGDRHLPVVYNEFLASMTNPTAESIETSAAALEGTGVEVFVIDAGWNQAPDAPAGNWWDVNGSWQADRTRFPDGLDGVANEIERRGMIPGIWIELESVGSHAEIRDLKPNWFARRDDHVIEEGGGRRFLDFSQPEVAEHARGVIEERLAEGFGYWKIDYNVEIPLGTDHRDGLGAGLDDHVRAFRRWLADLRTDHPQLIIENCASGGNRLDYGLLALTDLCSITDHAVWDSAWHTLPGLVSGVAYGVHPSQLGVWAALDGDIDLRETIYRLVTTFVGRVHLSGRMETLSADQRSLVTEALAFYRNWRHVVATARVHHLAEPVSLHRPTDWVALQLSADVDDHIVAVWRRDSAENEMILRLADLDRHAAYSLWRFPGGTTMQRTGDELANGLRVSLDHRFEAVAFAVQRVESSAHVLPVEVPRGLEPRVDRI